MKLIKNETRQKLRGGFYTPGIIAEFILKWGIAENNQLDILEPSCGDGIFLKKIRECKYKYKSITAIELDEIEARKVSKIELKDKYLINTDFHIFCNETKKKYDLIIGNPPYIRYQYFNRLQQIEARKIFQRVNLKYSKLTNSWVSFVLGSTILLKEIGKIGFVLPAEILQVSYAKILRNYLSNFFNKITIISFEKLIFPDIQQEVILLLCEKNHTNSHLIKHLEIYNAENLKELKLSKHKNNFKRMDFHSNKWTFYFLDQKEIDFLEEVALMHKIPTIGDFADVQVGITTGSNEFFTVPLEIVKKYKLDKYAKPLAGRSVQINGIIFSRNDWLQNSEKNIKSYLLLFPSIKELKKNSDVLKYIQLGEEKGINKGYKCSIRNEWQVVPSIWISDAFFIRRNHLHSKLIVNQSKAYSTDTLHRVKIHNKANINKKAFVASFYNSLSFAYSEITGRSYGGGVLEIMPSEVEKILLPYSEKNADLLYEIDLMFRKNIQINEILKYTNSIVLQNNFGFSKKEICLSNNILKKLSQRRLNRK